MSDMNNEAHVSILPRQSLFQTSALGLFLFFLLLLGSLTRFSLGSLQEPSSGFHSYKYREKNSSFSSSPVTFTTTKQEKERSSIVQSRFFGVPNKSLDNTLELSSSELILSGSITPSTEEDSIGDRDMFKGKSIKDYNTSCTFFHMLGKQCERDIAFNVRQIIEGFENSKQTDDILALSVWDQQKQVKRCLKDILFLLSRIREMSKPFDDDVLFLGGYFKEKNVKKEIGKLYDHFDEIQRDTIPEKAIKSWQEWLKLAQSADDYLPVSLKEKKKSFLSLYKAFLKSIVYDEKIKEIRSFVDQKAYKEAGKCQKELKEKELKKQAKEIIIDEARELFEEIQSLTSTTIGCLEQMGKLHELFNRRSQLYRYCFAIGDRQVPEEVIVEECKMIKRCEKWFQQVLSELDNLLAGEHFIMFDTYYQILGAQSANVWIMTPLFQPKNEKNIEERKENEALDGEDKIWDLDDMRQKALEKLNQNLKTIQEDSKKAIDYKHDWKRLCDKEFCSDSLKQCLYTNSYADTLKFIQESIKRKWDSALELAENVDDKEQATIFHTLQLLEFHIPISIKGEYDKVLETWEEKTMIRWERARRDIDLLFEQQEYEEVIRKYKTNQEKKTKLNIKKNHYIEQKVIKMVKGEMDKIKEINKIFSPQTFSSALDALNRMKAYTALFGKIIEEISKLSLDGEKALMQVLLHIKQSVCSTVSDLSSMPQWPFSQLGNQLKICITYLQWVKIEQQKLEQYPCLISIYKAIERFSQQFRRHVEESIDIKEKKTLSERISSRSKRDLKKIAAMFNPQYATWFSLLEQFIALYADIAQQTDKICFSLNELKEAENMPMLYLSVYLEQLSEEVVDVQLMGKYVRGGEKDRRKFFDQRILDLGFIRKIEQKELLEEMPENYETIIQKIEKLIKREADQAESTMDGELDRLSEKDCEHCQYCLYWLSAFQWINLCNVLKVNLQNKIISKLDKLRDDAKKSPEKCYASCIVLKKISLGLSQYKRRCEEIIQELLEFFYQEKRKNFDEMEQIFGNNREKNPYCSMLVNTQPRLQNAMVSRFQAKTRGMKVEDVLKNISFAQEDRNHIDDFDFFENDEKLDEHSSEEESDEDLRLDQEEKREILEQIEKENDPKVKKKKKRIYKEYKMYKKTYDNLVEEYILDVDYDKKEQKDHYDPSPIVDKTKKLLEEKRQNSFSSCSSRVLAHIAFVWTLLDAKSKEIIKKKANQYPNWKNLLLCPLPCQIVGIFCMLSIGEEDYRHQLTEIPTGNGKTVLLGVLGIMLALEGYNATCICYSEYLTNRDRKVFAQVRRHFNVDNYISYKTFDQYCPDLIQKQINLFRLRNLIRKLFSGQRVQFVPEEEEEERTEVLLVDEIDFLLKSSFLGVVSNYIAMIQTSPIPDLFDYIWNNRKNDLTLDKVKLSDAYEKCKEKLNQDYIHRFLEKQIPKLLEGVKPFTSQGAPNVSRPYIVKEDKIWYKYLDGLTSSTYYGYETPFTYYYENEKSKEKISDTAVQKQKALYASYGLISYAEILKESREVPLILGTTGSLNVLSQKKKDFIKEQYKMNSWTYVPNAFSSNKRQFPYFEVLKDSNNLYESLTRFIKQELTGEFSKGPRAVLVFFENKKKIDDYKESCYFNELENYYELTHSANEDERSSLIEKTCTLGRLTLTTKEFSRGVDYVPYDEELNDNGGLCIVATYISETPEEDYQLDGRTARQGSPGSKAVFLTYEDLAEVGVPREQRKEIIRDMRIRQRGIGNDRRIENRKSCEALYKEITQFRNRRLVDKLEQRIKKVEESAKTHQETMEVIRAVKKGNQEGIDQLIEFVLKHS